MPHNVMKTEIRLLRKEIESMRCWFICSSYNLYQFLDMGICWGWQGHLPHVDPDKIHKLLLKKHSSPDILDKLCKLKTLKMDILVLIRAQIYI